MRFFINAGHAPNGIPDPGAIGPTGLRECDVCWDVGKMVTDYLRSVGHEVQLLQHDDLWIVCDTANNAGIDAFISIHCNGFTSPAAKGMEIYTTKGYTAADPLADCIMRQMADAWPVLNVRGDWSDGDVDKEAGLYVLNNTIAPAVLVELAFITNPDEEAILRTHEGKDRFAAAIARGITDWAQVA